MVGQLRNLWTDEAGFIISAEMVIILTISVLGMVTGLVCLQNAILGEFADLSLAFQSLNQSYATPYYMGCWKWWGRTSWYSGSMFIDVFDGCVYGTGAAASYQQFDSGCEVTSGTGCVTTPSATGTVTESTTLAPATTVTPCPQPAVNQAVPNGTVLPGVPCQNCQ